MTAKSSFLVFFLLSGLLSLGAAELFVETYSVKSIPFVSDLTESESIRDVLKKAGMKFPEGADAVIDRESGQLTLINTREAIETFEDGVGIDDTFSSPPLHVLVEFIELESQTYHDWMFENRLQGDATPLRRQVQKWVRSEEATIIETVVMQALSGNRAKSESYSFLIYPSEGDPPELPQKVDLEGAVTVAPITGGVSAAFDCRNVGTTVEVDAVVGVDGKTVDLSLAPQIVKENGFTDWPPEGGDRLFTLSQPRFFTMIASTKVTTRSGQYAFLGTANPLAPAVATRKKPIVLLFVRCDVSQTVKKERTRFVVDAAPEVQ